jgi:hypothetical protein
MHMHPWPFAADFPAPFSFFSANGAKSRPRQISAHAYDAIQSIEFLNKYQNNRYQEQIL